MRIGLATTDEPCQNLSTLKTSSMRNGDQLRARFVVARTGVAALLLLALLSISFPLATLAGAPACTLACCAGLPSHAAGSCMGGSCHSGLLREIHTTTVVDEQDSLCGLSKEFGATLTVPTVYADSAVAPESVRTESQLSSSVLTKPCQAECGVCVSGTNNSNRQRKSVLSNTIKSITPPTSAEIEFLAPSVGQFLDPLRYHAGSRGPPNSLS